MTKEELLFDICKRTAAVGDYEPKVYGICYLAEALNEENAYIQILLEALEADGMLVKTRSRNYIGDDGKSHYRKGWTLSDTARKSELYQQCKQDAEEEFAQWKKDFANEWNEGTHTIHKKATKSEKNAIVSPLETGACENCRRHYTKDGKDICSGGLVRGRLGRYAEATNCERINICRRFADKRFKGMF